MESIGYIMSKAWDILTYDLIISPFELPLWTFGAFPIVFAFCMKLVFKRKKL